MTDNYWTFHMLGRKDWVITCTIDWRQWHCHDLQSRCEAIAEARKHIEAILENRQ